MNTEQLFKKFQNCIIYIYPVSTPVPLIIVAALGARGSALGSGLTVARSPVRSSNKYVALMLQIPATDLPIYDGKFRFSSNRSASAANFVELGSFVTEGSCKFDRELAQSGLGMI